MINKTDKYKIICSFLKQQRLSRAISLLSTMVEKTQQSTLVDRLNDIETNHNLLIQYFIQNTKDPHRMQIFKNLIRLTYELAEDTNEYIKQRESSRHDYAMIREVRQIRLSNNYDEILQRLERFDEKLLSRFDYELQQGELFNIFWTQSFFVPELVSFYQQVQENPKISTSDKCLAVSALTLNLFRHFSEQKLNLLFDTCLHSNIFVQQRALVGLCFVLTKYDSMIGIFDNFTTRLSIFRDNVFLLEKIKTIVNQIIRTSETQDISNKLNNEIIPEILKAKSELKNKFDSDTIFIQDDIMEPNPEWSDFLEESGIDKKMKEISDLQMDGADVYMSTFASLKNLPFFDQSYRWFLIFDKNYSEVSHLFNPNEKNLFDTFINSNTLCNSDKYSFCMAMQQMPEIQRGAMKNSFAEQLDQIEENEKNASEKEKKTSNQYIQELYRYYKLNKRLHKEDDIFVYALQLHKTHFFKLLFSENEHIMSVANFYFSQKRYEQALDLFTSLESLNFDLELSQKMAFSYQQLGKIPDAIACYERADLIAPHNPWTLRRLAFCLRVENRFNEALRCYEQLSDSQPADIQIRLHLAYCLTELGNTHEALSIYYKLEFEKPNDEKIMRALAWCLFLEHNYLQAEKYWSQVLSLNPNAVDYLNAAHVAWCLSKRDLALMYYKRSKTLSASAREFFESFMKDQAHLLAHGVTPTELTLLIDAI